MQIFGMVYEDSEIHSRAITCGRVDHHGIEWDLWPDGWGSIPARSFAFGRAINLLCTFSCRSHTMCNSCYRLY